MLQYFSKTKNHITENIEMILSRSYILVVKLIHKHLFSSMNTLITNTNCSPIERWIPLNNISSNTIDGCNSIIVITITITYRDYMSNFTAHCFNIVHFRLPHGIS